MMMVTMKMMVVGMINDCDGNNVYMEITAMVMVAMMMATMMAMMMVGKDAGNDNTVINSALQWRR